MKPPEVEDNRESNRFHKLPPKASQSNNRGLVVLVDKHEKFMGRKREREQDHTLTCSVKAPIDYKK